MATLTNTNYFSPTQIAGCALWLDAADESSVSRTGVNVTAWNDKSGNARNMSNNASYQSPTYNTTGFNGRPTISFVRNSSNNFTILENTSFSFTQNSFSLFFMSQKTGSDAVVYQRFFSAVATIGGQDYNTSNNFNINSGLTNTSIDYEKNGKVIGAFTITNPFLGEVIVNGTGSVIGRYNSLTNYIYANGSQVNASTTPTAGANFNSVHVRLGSATYAPSSNDGNILSFNGNISEVIFFNRALTTIESQQVEGYLAWKWGLQAGLPTTHPYFYNPMIPNLILPAQLTNPFTTTNTTLVTTNPTQIAGCALWLDAADSASVIRTGVNVTAWNDKSGNGYNATAFGTGSPTYSSNSIVFTGTQAFATTLQSLIPNQSGFAIVKYSSAAKINILSLTRTSGSGTAGIQQIIENNLQRTTTYGNNPIVSGATLTQNTMLLYNHTFSASSNAFLYVNGSQTGQTTGPYSFSGTGTINIGGYDAGPGEGFIGSMNEILLFNVVLTTTQRQQIEGYLAWKWGLQANLPTTHPYFYNPLIPNLILPSQVYSLAPSFSPLRFSGSALWLDAADTASITLIGNNITNVNDKSGQNVVLSNATGFSYRTNLFNGSYPSFYNPNGGVTNATNARLGVNASFAITVPFTVFFVGHDITTTSDYGYVIDSGPTGISTNRPYIYNGYLITQFGQSATLSARSPFQGCAQFYSIPRMFVNGRSVYTGSLTGFTTPGITVGNRLSLNEAWPGHICEIIIYNRSITLNEQQQIEGYLAWKWGLQTSLPATHPYFFAPPS